MHYVTASPATLRKSWFFFSFFFLRATASDQTLEMKMLTWLAVGSMLLFGAWPEFRASCLSRRAAQSTHKPSVLLTWLTAGMYTDAALVSPAPVKTPSLSRTPSYSQLLAVSAAPAQLRPVQASDTDFLLGLTSSPASPLGSPASQWQLYN